MTTMSDTFIPSLAAAVAWCHYGDDAMIEDTRGPVLELGMGDGSTRLLHSLCKAMCVPLVSLENNLEWYAKFLDLSTRDHRGHQMHRVTGWNAVSLDPEAYALNCSRWSVAFVDHAPGERRVADIVRLANNATIIVVHDTEEPGYNYEPTLATFRHRFDDKTLTPWTTLVSNFVDVGAIFR